MLTVNTKNMTMQTKVWKKATMAVSENVSLCSTKIPSVFVTQHPEWYSWEFHRESENPKTGFGLHHVYWFFPREGLLEWHGFPVVGGPWVHKILNGIKLVVLYSFSASHCLTFFSSLNNDPLKSLPDSNHGIVIYILREMQLYSKIRPISFWCAYETSCLTTAFSSP